MSGISDEDWAYLLVAHYEVQIIVAEWGFEMFDLTGCLDSGLL